MNGARGLGKEVPQVFGDYSKLQRCIWHKRETMVRELNREGLETGIFAQTWFKLSISLASLRRTHGLVVVFRSGSLVAQHEYESNLSWELSSSRSQA